MDKHPTILVVEDDRDAALALVRLLELGSYQAISSATIEQAKEHIDDGIDLVLSDLRLGHGDGLELMESWRAKRPTTPFILMTAFGQVASAVSAMKRGADDYLTKPIDPDELLLQIHKCLESRAKDARLEHLEEQLDQKLGLDRIVGQSAVMQDVFARVRRAARSDSTVLILGESGTGKELIAQALHQNSPRKDKLFIAVNMAAVPDSLVESELFGHVKGSFTGATSNRVGRFQAAQGGTIFIDEIGDFALASQAKLLRVLEARTITPVGGNDEQAVDVRVVAATSRNLEAMIADGKFREDLYYRLGVVTLPLPPLRERLDDVPLLIRHFLNELGNKNDRPGIELEPELARVLESFHWPGNVRQLRNCLESMVVLSDKSILTLADLPAGIQPRDFDSPNGVRPPSNETIESIEKTAMLQALERFGGNRTRAAESLGISVRTLQRKLISWGIQNAEKTRLT